MRLQEIMNENVEIVAPTLSAELAWERMRSRRFHHLVVCDGGSIAGVISDRDLGGEKGSALRKGKAVVDLMTRQVVSASGHRTVRQVANLFRGHAIGCLPVVDGGKLVGIVTVSDLLELLGRGAEKPVEKSKRWTLKHRGGAQRATNFRR